MDRAPLSDGSSPDLYELDLERAIGVIRRSGASRVGLQAPEGLKRACRSIASEIARQTGAEVMISGDPCFGACDIDLELCSEVELMIHIGHAEMLEADKVIYLEARIRADPSEVVRRAASELRERRVGVATTIQHLHRIDQVLQALREVGIEGVLGPAGGRVRHPGQVLGCCYTSVRELDVREHLFIGTGQFHPLGIALSTGKRVVAADPLTGKVFEIDTYPMLRQRYGSISRASDAARFAVLISKKPGQRRLELARRIREIGERSGREMLLVYLDNVEPDRLLNLGVDAAVCTACPRIALDDSAKFRIPVLTPQEFEILVGERRWEEYELDEVEA